jgi:acyl carrier protein
MTRAQRIRPEDVETVVFSAVDRLNELLPPTGQLERSRAALLLADGTSLDSMAVVNLLVFIEEEMLNELDREITLAGAEGEAELEVEALATVGTLIDAICQQLT